MPRSLFVPVFFALSLGVLACTDDGGGSEGETETGATGDGDGDPAPGDGDGDPSTTTTGDGDGDPSTGDGDGDPTTTGDGDGDPEPLCANGTAPGVCQSDPMGDAYWLDNLAIQDDCLIVDVSSSGGCADHVYTSCWDQSFAESEPVQATVWLDHDAMDDPCEAIVNENLIIDLGPLRAAYVEAYQVDTGTIIINVADQSINYDF